jgi:hypothetical protein
VTSEERAQEELPGEPFELKYCGHSDREEDDGFSDACSGRRQWMMVKACSLVWYSIESYLR